MVADVDSSRSLPREIPSVTLGVAFLKHPDPANFQGGPSHTALICVCGRYDPTQGWIDTDGPDFGYGLEWFVETVLVEIGLNWPGYVVQIHWELDAGTRAEAEKLGLELPTRLKVPGTYLR